MRKYEAPAFVDFYFPQRAPFFPRLPRYYMLYFVHRLNTNMFLNMSIKLKAAISKLLACVIVAFFVGKITLNRLSLYNEHLKLNTKKLIDFGKFNQHFHSIYCSNIIYVGAADSKWYKRIYFYHYLEFSSLGLKGRSNSCLFIISRSYQHCN